jgi:dihydrofolate reductase
VIISLIVAMDDANGIGKGGQLPWHLSTDLKRFKHLTMTHHVIMGRKTYESIGKPLSGRTNIIITRNSKYTLNNPEIRLTLPYQSSTQCLVAYSLENALSAAKANFETEAFVIGGGEVFREALPIAQRIHLTRIHVIIKCDVYFPTFNPVDWLCLEETFQPKDQNNQFPSTYFLLARKDG